MKLNRINISMLRIKIIILNIIEIISIKKDKIIMILHLNIEITLINILIFIVLINKIMFMRIIIINLIKERINNNKRLEHQIVIEMIVMKKRNKYLCNKHLTFRKILKLVKEDEQCISYNIILFIMYNLKYFFIMKKIFLSTNQMIIKAYLLRNLKLFIII